jgi:hypothetical protein
MAKNESISLDLAAARGTPGEKWIDVAIIHGLEDPRAIDGYFTGEMPDLVRSEAELPKDALIVKAFNIALGAINQVRHIVGYPEVTVTHDRLHLLPEEAYELAWPKSNGACTSLGHSYLTARDTFTVWHDLAHELAHVLGFWRQELHLEQTADGLAIRRLGSSRCGLRDVVGGKTVSGLGLDETAADIVASFARQALVKELGAHLGDEAPLFISTWDYPAHYLLAEELGKLIVRAGRARKPTKLLLQDFFGGTHRFVEALDGLVDTKLLLTVNEGNASVADFAERHDITLE